MLPKHLLIFEAVDHHLWLTALLFTLVVPRYNHTWQSYDAARLLPFYLCATDLAPVKRVLY